MTSFSQFLAHFAFIQMATCSVLLAPVWRKNQSAALFSLLLLLGCGYHLSDLFGPLNDMDFLWWVDYLSGNALPGVFWLVSLSIFGDHKVLKPWQYWLASSTLLIPFLTLIVQLVFAFDLRSYPAFYGLTKYGAMALELALICYAMIVAMKNWQDDLVQERRYMRGSIIALAGIYVFGIILIEQLFNVEWAWLRPLEFALLGAMMIWINLLLFTLRQGTLFDEVKSSSQEQSTHQSMSPELKRIVNAMTQEQLYREEGMTISVLAKHLAIHEYKLRKLINGELEYRNFNDFLNYYRIKEVSEKLEDTQQKDIPVLTLALESGFRSLSSFNKAFKATHGMTPTEYRHTHLAKS
ncbi:AraC family transcriptional regulator [Alteromonas sediminis]|uniref:AraC family transcriptional regulator n=1 Tax=Alteromonas sediminis TaxID=2259342 RepID=A0A3N5YQ08_9ALTE|nr:helix-turn-helix domain-containing protein [Alteromonas sediminis]RPJ68041.1 AraC family transcriptional regulator [Alteromonas sediminis]